MKTALDWLIEQMPYEFRAKYAYDLFKQAKELEKKQIVDAYNHNMTGFDKLEQEEIGLNWAEDYYNQTYSQQKKHIIDIMKADEDDGLYNPNK
jgi:hypothetical protein